MAKADPKVDQAQDLTAFRELLDGEGPLSEMLVMLHEEIGRIEDAEVAFELGQHVLEFAEDGVGDTPVEEYKAFATALEQLMPEGDRKCGKLVTRARSMTRVAREMRDHERWRSARAAEPATPSDADVGQILAQLGPPHAGHEVPATLAWTDPNPLLHALALWGGLVSFDAEGDFQANGAHAALITDIVRHAGVRIQAQDWRDGNTLFVTIDGVGTLEVEADDDAGSDYVIYSMVERAVIETLAKLAADWSLYELPGGGQLVRLLVLSEHAESALKKQPAWPTLEAERVKSPADVGFVRA